MGISAKVKFWKFNGILVDFKKYYPYENAHKICLGWNFCKVGPDLESLVIPLQNINYLATKSNIQGAKFGKT